MKHKTVNYFPYVINTFKILFFHDMLRIVINDMMGETLWGELSVERNGTVSQEVVPLCLQPESRCSV